MKNLNITIRELLKLVRKDKTPKISGQMFDRGGTCINGGLALTIGLDPIDDGHKIVRALNRGGRIDDATAIFGKKITSKNEPIGNVAMRANDSTLLSKRAIAERLLKALPEEQLDKTVRIRVPA